MGYRLSAALDDLEATTNWLLAQLESGDIGAALAGATAYLRLLGLAAGGAYLAKGALASLAEADPGAALRIATARFFAEQLLPETSALRVTISEGAGAILDTEPALPAA
jgi:hypothetical protein